jgi:integrase
MPRPASGSILPRTLADGNRSFRLRFHAYGQRHDVFLHKQPGCECGCGGGWDEPAARTELGNILARVRVGVWKPAEPPVAPEPPAKIPTFHEYASEWLQRKIDGVTTDRPLAEKTILHYRIVLTRHLLPIFATYPVDRIDRRACLDFKAHKLRESAELREALAAGADLRDHRNRRLTPAGPPQIRAAISVLAMILDEAIEDELIDHNPARGKRMRIRLPKPARSFLEVDELNDLLQAAATQDALPAIPAHEMAGESTRARVARRLAAGRRPIDIAAELGVVKATVTFHASRLGAGDPIGYIGRRAVIEILARGGVRASELCALRWRDVRLHDPDGARFHIRSAKTQTGIREVQMTPALVQALVEHRDRLDRASQPTGPDAFVVPNRRGGEMDRQRVAKLVTDAAALATQNRAGRGLPPLPHITPHSLRRTYISLALIANNFDVKWVMSQVGHADSKMTLDVYAQLEQRIHRSHGTSFDLLLQQASADGSYPAADDSQRRETAWA